MNRHIPHTGKTGKNDRRHFCFPPQAEKSFFGFLGSVGSVDIRTEPKITLGSVLFVFSYFSILCNRTTEPTLSNRTNRTEPNYLGGSVACSAPISQQFLNNLGELRSMLAEVLAHRFRINLASISAKFAGNVLERAQGYLAAISHQFRRNLGEISQRFRGEGGAVRGTPAFEIGFCD